MKCSVFIATYNQPRELDLALAGLSRQSRFPDEVLVADDGSGPEARGVTEYWQSRLPCELHHVWQEDTGYRKSRILNEAVRRSKGEHLVFMDGDCFPHHRWVEDHLAAANGRRVQCGRRVKLGPRISSKINREWVLGSRFALMHPDLIASALRRDTRRLLLGVRLPSVLARVFHPRPRKLMGVNFSLPREAFFDVNGFDEQWEFYGREDRDLELRLLRSGRPFYPLLNRAIVYHVHHDERPRSKECQQLIAAQERSERVRCEKGVSVLGVLSSGQAS